jgi:hypothetical protein
MGRPQGRAEGQELDMGHSGLPRNRDKALRPSDRAPWPYYDGVRERGEMHHNLIPRGRARTVARLLFLCPILQRSVSSGRIISPQASR